MKTRIVYTKIHEDDYFRGLSDREQCFFFFLLTNEKINLCGMYQCPDWYILGLKPAWSKKALEAMKNRFMGDKKFIFLDGWVRVVNYEKYNMFTGEKNEIACNRELLSVPEGLKNYNLDTLSMDYRYPIDSPSNHNHNHNHIAEPRKTKAIPLTNLDLEDLAKSTGFSMAKIDFTYAKVLDYEKAHGKAYKDYKAAVRTFLRNDLKFNQGGVI